MLHQIKAQQFYIDLGLYQKCKVLQKIVEFKNFSRLLSDFPVLFKADLIFMDISRSPLNSSTFQACTNPISSGSGSNIQRVTFNKAWGQNLVTLRVIFLDFVQEWSEM